MKTLLNARKYKVNQGIRIKHYSMEGYEKKTCDQEMHCFQSKERFVKKWIELKSYIDAFIINIKIDIYI